MGTNSGVLRQTLFIYLAQVLEECSNKTRHHLGIDINDVYVFYPYF